MEDDDIVAKEGFKEAKEVLPHVLLSLSLSLYVCTLKIRI
jgi:hypothetical protein